MQADIHPKNYTAVLFKCSCGAEFTVRSTVDATERRIDVCSACHPFSSGKMRLVDTAGRIDKFKQKYGEE